MSIKQVKSVRLAYTAKVRDSITDTEITNLMIDYGTVVESPGEDEKVFRGEIELDSFESLSNAKDCICEIEEQLCTLYDEVDIYIEGFEVDIEENEGV